MLWQKLWTISILGRYQLSPLISHVFLSQTNSVEVAGELWWRRVSSNVYSLHIQMAALKMLMIGCKLVAGWMHWYQLRLQHQAQQTPSCEQPMLAALGELTASLQQHSTSCNTGHMTTTVREKLMDWQNLSPGSMPWTILTMPNGFLYTCGTWLNFQESIQI